MAKLKLDSPARPDVFLIAISSHENDYRLCWSLNNTLGLSLCRRKRDLEGKGPEQPAHFAVFDHVEQDTETIISLVANHAPEGVLVAEQRHADYFLVVDGDDGARHAEMLELVRQAEFVLAAFSIDINTVKGAYNLLQ